MEVEPVEIRYSRVMKGRRYWHATPALKRLGFSDVACGKEGPTAQAKALTMTAKAVKALETGDTREGRPAFKPGTVGHMIAAYESSGVFKRKSEANRQQLEYDHKVIAHHLGDKRLTDLTEDDVIRFYDDADAENGPYARWHALKALKKLLQRAADRHVIRFNPASEVTNPQPSGRDQTWTGDEITKLIEGARELKYEAVALCIELMDCCGFQPVDARTLTPSMLARVGPVCVIDRGRAKTGQTGIWAIPDELYGRIEAYSEALGITVMPDTLLFRRHASSTETGQPLPWRNQREFSRDFKDVREHVFGKEEKRRAMDIRRSVSVDTDLAGMTREERATMLANSMDRNPSLHKVYTPDTVEAAVRALEKRIEGRALRTNPAPALKFFNGGTSGVETDES